MEAGVMAEWPIAVGGFLQAVGFNRRPAAAFLFLRGSRVDRRLGRLAGQPRGVQGKFGQLRDGNRCGGTRRTRASRRDRAFDEDVWHHLGHRCDLLVTNSVQHIANRVLMVGSG